MEYVLPKCDCGENLFVYEEVGVSVETAVTKKGLKSKRSKRSAELLVSHDRLRCGNCLAEWWIEEDSMGRIIKGDKF